MQFNLQQQCELSTPFLSGFGGKKKPVISKAARSPLVCAFSKMFRQIGTICWATCANRTQCVGRACPGGFRILPESAQHAHTQPVLQFCHRRGALSLNSKGNKNPRKKLSFLTIADFCLHPQHVLLRGTFKPPPGQKRRLWLQRLFLPAYAQLQHFLIKLMRFAKDEGQLKGTKIA